MPKQKRWIIKRNMDQAGAHIDGAIEDLVSVGYEFKDVHPDYYQAFSMAVANLNAIKYAVAELKDLI